MYNIAITKEKETKFFSDAGGKPKRYPTLADALVSAQYLGLTRQDAELHFVKDGTAVESIAGTAAATLPPQAEEEGGGETGKSPDKMNRAELAAYAEGKGIAVSDGDTKAVILAAVKEAEKRGEKTGDTSQAEEEGGDRRE